MNTTNTQHKTEQLTDAFRIFNQLSQNLAESYQGLEEQVAKLTQELAAARSERLKTLVEQEHLAHRLRTILAALPAGVVIVDETQTIIDCNTLAIDLLGEPLLGLAWPDVVRERLATLADNPLESELPNHKRVNLTLSPLDDHGGQLILLTDVTDMRALQESLSRQKQLSAMGEMVASMAHQVRTPLATAILYASQMSKPSIDNSKRQNFAVKILERLHHLNHQVNDMLIFAKEGRLTMETFSLHELLRQVGDVMANKQDGKRIRFELINQSHIDSLQGNLNALQGALLNLLTNAIDAVNGDGLVYLQVCDQPNGLHIRVVDNGCGIPEEWRHRINEPFFTTKANGTGLGLAVVDSVVKAHGGTLACESTPGQGSVFSIHLPVSTHAFAPLLSELPLSAQHFNKESRHASI